MTSQLRKKTTFILISGAVLGLTVDFLFNGVIVRQYLTTVANASWAFVYIPVYLMLAATFSTIISRASFVAPSEKTVMAIRAAVGFMGGAILAHLVLVGFHTSRSYEMILVPDSPITLFRSNEWPQILFVESDRVKRQLTQNSGHDKIPVILSIITDYGCIRSALVTNVAGIDVKNDSGSTWTWRRDVHSKADEKDGPGEEDHVLPWCGHLEGIKAMEDGPQGTRPWDVLLEKIDR